jgi:hypothetical protein
MCANGGHTLIVAPIAMARQTTTKASLATVAQAKVTGQKMHKYLQQLAHTGTCQRLRRRKHAMMGAPAESPYKCMQ